LVAAIERSGPARSARTWSAPRASDEPSPLVMATVLAPVSRARASQATTSGVSPDCEIPIASSPGAAAATP
jgi:hypothetical protein